MTDPQDPLAGARNWYLAGSVVQGLIMGPLVTFALFNLIRMASDATIFRYQGF